METLSDVEEVHINNEVDQPIGEEDIAGASLVKEVSSISNLLEKKALLLLTQNFPNPLMIR